MEKKKIFNILDWALLFINVFLAVAFSMIVAYYAVEVKIMIYGDIYHNAILNFKEYILTAGATGFCGGKIIHYLLERIRKYVYKKAWGEI